ncbi:hypothetical protein FFK22_039850 [Mycobacterium sp. KBS0706]|uniref:hypothetical protein n=1 Tax=Mycobacterium sp. KBS0706 TaxID=2578109 RepID=UPI00110F9259|nr:hypothetical protein [Mycobacterium sp. KBS0706]TSD83035.1 hypothetical protein FFK22_039850 [Mycobacterium sp. KBS0706]
MPIDRPLRERSNWVISDPVLNLSSSRLDMDDEEFLSVLVLKAVSAMVSRDRAELQKGYYRIRGNIEYYFNEMNLYPGEFVPPATHADCPFHINRLNDGTGWAIDAPLKLTSGEISDLEIRMTIYHIPTTIGFLIAYHDILVP